MMGAGIGAPDGVGPTSGSLDNAGGAAGTLLSFPIWISRGGPGTGGLVNLTRSRNGNERSCRSENPVIGAGEAAAPPCCANIGSAAINSRRAQHQNLPFLIYPPWICTAIVKPSKSQTNERPAKEKHPPAAKDHFCLNDGLERPRRYGRNGRSSTSKTAKPRNRDITKSRGRSIGGLRT